MEPVFCGEIEVASGTDVDRCGTDFSRDVDAAFHVGQEERTVGVADLAANIQVLWARGCRDGAKTAIEAISLCGESVLRDADDTLATLSRFAQTLFIEIGCACIQGHQGTVEGVDAVGFADTNIVDFQAERRLVLDGDVGFVVREQTTSRKGHIDRCAGSGVCRDVDQSGRRFNRGQAQEELVKLAARHHGVAAIGLAGQAHFFQLAVDLFQQGLVTRNGLSVARVAGHPADNFGAVFKQLVGHIGIHQAGQCHVFGFEDVKVVTQFAGQFLALVAGLHLHLQPTAAEVLGGGVDGDGLTRALEPAAIAAAHDIVAHHIHVAGGAQLVGGGHQSPAGGVGVILFVEYKVQVGVAARGQLVSRTRDTHAVIRAHQFHDGAGGHPDRHIFELQGHIVVGLRGVQPECGFFGLVQVQARFTRTLDGRDAFGHVGVGLGAAHQVGVTRNRIRLNADHGLVVHARFDEGLVADHHLVGAAQRLGTLRHEPGEQTTRTEVEHRAIELGLAHAFFSQQVDIAHCANGSCTLQFDVVLLIQ